MKLVAGYIRFVPTGEPYIVHVDDVSTIDQIPGYFERWIDGQWVKIKDPFEAGKEALDV